jgi:nitrite reductase/ring-hydroxylating ferredoxin subunit
MTRWFPVARADDVVPRHVVHTQLLGQELAVWRDDADGVNAWENRCPHRGVRLSIGTNTGTELRCRYHAWRFAGGSGRCSFIPSHPTQKPASTLRARVYPVHVRGGHVWVTLDPLGTQALGTEHLGTEHLGTEHLGTEHLGTEALGREAEGPPLLIPAAYGLSLRSVYVRAPAARVAAELQRGYRLHGDIDVPVVQSDEFALEARPAGASNDTARQGSAREGWLQLWLQPMSTAETTIHGTIFAAAHAAADTPIPATERLRWLRHHNLQLTSLRDASERSGL